LRSFRGLEPSTRWCQMCCRGRRQPAVADPPAIPRSDGSNHRQIHADDGPAQCAAYESAVCDFAKSDTCAPCDLLQPRKRHIKKRCPDPAAPINYRKIARPKTELACAIEPSTCLRMSIPPGPACEPKQAKQIRPSTERAILSADGLAPHTVLNLTSQICK